VLAFLLGSRPHPFDDGERGDRSLQLAEPADLGEGVVP
jgi:hypothetical protein